jgi:hypothetical protein
MHLERIAAAGVAAAMFLALGATAASATTSTTTAPSGAPATSTCLPANHDDAWPAWADGRPARDPGVRVWHDATGWHVRVTHNSLHDRTFSGEIATTGELVGVDAVRLERGDVLNVGAGKHVIAFSFDNYGGTDGFDFVTHCAPALEFGFKSDDKVVPVNYISIGRTDRHPAHNPFVIARSG